ncbi:MAG: DUF3726 domain-containing protein [Arenicella sp.]|nr:DUF3726 domain-containing protein [Arenicella sp.]
MKASQTELLTLFKQAFEGIGFDAGRYESAADMVVWAEMHGLDVFARLPAKLDRLSESSAPLIEKPSSAGGDLMFDAGDKSALACGELICNAVFASAVNRGICSATISRIYDRQLMTKKIVDCCARGAHCLSYWQDADEPGLVHAITSDAGAQYPQISSYQCQAEVEPQALYLVCAMDPEGTREYALAHCSFINKNPLKRIEPNELSAAFQQSLSNGIEITDTLWDRLRCMANNVLVESTEQSRKGAGA